MQTKKLNCSHHCLDKGTSKTSGHVTRYVYNSKFVDKHLFSKSYVSKLVKTSVCRGTLYSDVVKNSIVKKSDSGKSAFTPSQKVVKLTKSKSSPVNVKKITCPLRNKTLAKNSNFKSRNSVQAFQIKTDNRFQPLTELEHKSVIDKEMASDHSHAVYSKKGVSDTTQNGPLHVKLLSLLLPIVRLEIFFKRNKQMPLKVQILMANMTWECYF